MEGFEKPNSGLRSEGESLGDILRQALEEQEAKTPQVKNGALEVSAYSEEQLGSVEGIVPGVFLKGVNVRYFLDIRTSRVDPYILSSSNLYERGLKINSKYLAIDRRQNPTLPTKGGLNDFEVTGIDEEYIYLSALNEAGLDGGTVETLEIENGEVDFFSYAGGSEQAYNVPGLKLETKLNNVFIYPDLIENSTDRLPLKINGRNVRFAGYSSRPDEADFQDLVVRGITDEDIYVDYEEEDVERVDAGGFNENSKFEVGAVVEDVVFEVTDDGRYIAQNPDGKAFILDTSSEFSFEEVTFGFPVKVRIVRDTKPGERDGFYVVSFLQDAPDELITDKEGGGESNYEKGEVIKNISFEYRNGKYVSSNPNGKAFLLDESAYFPFKVIGGESINVKFLRDTKPGSVDGFYVVAFDEGASVDRRDLKDGRVDFEGIYKPGEERRVTVEGLNVGSVISNLRYVSEDSGPLIEGLSINRLRVFDETRGGSTAEQSDADYKVVKISPGAEYIDLERVKKVSDYDVVLERFDGAVDFRSLDRPRSNGGENVDIYVEGLSVGTEFKNVYIDTARSRGELLPFLLNGKRLDYEDSVLPPKSGFYDLVVQNEGRVYYDVVLTDSSREKIGTTEQVTVLERDLASEPLHEDFLKHQVSQFHIPSIQTALRQARVGIPEMSYGREVLARGREMRQTGEEGERHRHFSALGAALFREKAAYRSFNAGIDVAVQHSSSRMREWLKGWEKREPPRMPLAVIGSGPHGATFLSTYRMYESSHNPLVIDQREHIGGQFADAEEPVFRLNSRNRPQMEGNKREERNLPGGEQTINPLGTMATLQVSDLSGEAYVTQDVLSYATRFNTITSAKDFLTECRLIAVEHVTREDGAEVERCTFFDEDESLTYTIDFDELVIAGGIGKDVFNFKDSDRSTRRFISEQREKLDRGERPTIMSFPQMIEWFGNPANKSPLKGVKEVVVSGSGDSANVAVGLLLGYEPGADRMPVSMDRVEKVYWVGQDIPTKEKWLSQIRTRYAQVGLEFPRERIESYYSRIVPVEGKASDADYSFSNEGKEGVSVYREGESRLEADLYIACNGFRNDLPGVLAANGLEARPIFDFFTGGINASGDKVVPGMVFKQRFGSSEARVLGIDNNSIEYLIKTNRGTEVKNVTRDDFFDFINDEFSSRDTLLVPERGINYDELFDEDGFAVGKRVRGTGVKLVGPVSELSISRQERRTAPVLEQIPENTAALFRYGRGTEKVARMVAKRLSTVPADAYDSMSETKQLVLQKGGEKVATGPVGKRINLQENPKEVPYHVPHLEALKVSLADHFARLQFPPNLSEVTVSVSMQPYLRRSQQLSYGLEGLEVSNLSDNESSGRIRGWLEELGNDEILVAAVEQEAKAHLKRVVGKDKLKAVEVRKKVSELEKLTGDRVLYSGADETRRMVLQITVPVQGSRAEAMQLRHDWVEN